MSKDLKNNKLSINLFKSTMALPAKPRSIKKPESKYPLQTESTPESDFSTFITIYKVVLCQINE